MTAASSATTSEPGAEPGRDPASPQPVDAVERVPERTGGISPFHAVAALGAAGLVWLSTGPVNDIDSYWHVVIGRQIIRQHSLDHLGTQWLAVPARSWQTSQWLCEVAMAGVVDAFGWRGLIAGRLLLLLAAMAAVALTLLPRRPTLVAVPVFLLALTGMIGLAQDRPQTVSYIFIPLLGRVCVDVWESGRRPPLVAVALCSLVWAQVHGLWILAPASFALVAVGRLLDHRRGGLRGARHAALAAVVSGGAGMLNPLGATSYLLPLRFLGSTDVVSEWRRTTFDAPYTGALALAVLVAVLAWARAHRPPPWTEVLWVVAWAVFSSQAYRNVTPAVLLLAPAVLAAACRTWGERARRYQRRTVRVERAVLTGLSVVLVTGSFGVAAARVARLDPLRDTPALEISRYVAALPAPITIYDGYNASGSLIAFGGGRARLFLDGRADYWGNDYIREVTGTPHLDGDWEGALARACPQAIVQPDGAPLVTLLLREGSWRELVRSGGWVMLEPVSGTPAARCSRPAALG